MKKILSLMVMTMMVLSVMPMVLGVGVGGGVALTIGESCEAPQIYVDPTSKIWNPNAETLETASVTGYDTAIDNAAVFYPYDDTVATIGYQGDRRSDYVFTGETMSYYLAVYDENGEDDIDSARILVNGTAVNPCVEVTDASVVANVMTYLDEVYHGGVPIATEADADTFINTNFDLDTTFDSLVGTNDASYKFFECTLLVASSQTAEYAVTLDTTDGAEDACSATPTTVATTWSDTLDFNPTLALSLTGGDIDFGSVTEGSVAISNTITFTNNAESGSNVVVDTYISADDYFMSLDPTDICENDNLVNTNGIDNEQFSYRAENGAFSSTINDETANGLSSLALDCGFVPATGGYTLLPEETGDVEDMCRIINNDVEGSLLQEGEAPMYITFRLDVPATCSGSFTEGEFNFVGRVV